MKSCFSQVRKANLCCEYCSLHLFYWEEFEVFFFSYIFVYGKRINVICITQCLGNVLQDISGMDKVQHSLEPKCLHYLANIVQMFLTHFSMCVVDSTVEHTPEPEGKLQRSKLSLFRKSGLWSLIRTSKAIGNPRFPMPWLSFFFSLDSTFRTSSIQHLYNFWKESSTTVIIKIWSVDLLSLWDPFKWSVRSKLFL